MTPRPTWTGRGGLDSTVRPRASTTAMTAARDHNWHPRALPEHIAGTHGKPLPMPWSLVGSL